MLICEECGKKLSIFKGYCHPTMGKNHLLCSSCFDVVSNSVDKWKEFVLANSFNKKSTKKDLLLICKKISLSFTNKKKIFDNILPDNEINHI